MTRLPNCNLLLVVRVAEALRSPVAARAECHVLGNSCQISDNSRAARGPSATFLATLARFLAISAKKNASAEIHGGYGRRRPTTSLTVPMIQRERPSTFN